MSSLQGLQLFKDTSKIHTYALKAPILYPFSDLHF